MNLFTSPKTRGFTLAQMLIVGAIIAIMSAIIYPQFSQTRKKARDVQRVADLETLRIALRLYKEKYGTYTVSGSGSNGTGQGWTSYSGDTTYTKSVTQALYEKGLLSSPNIGDPTQGGTGYMIYLCNGGLTGALSATKEVSVASETTFALSTCNGSGSNGTVSKYGKNYAVPLP